MGICLLPENLIVFTFVALIVTMVREAHLLTSHHLEQQLQQFFFHVWALECDIQSFVLLNTH